MDVPEIMTAHKSQALSGLMSVFMGNDLRRDSRLVRVPACLCPGFVSWRRLIVMLRAVRSTPEIVRGIWD